jgi:hypothetical protein
MSEQRKPPELSQKSRGNRLPALPQLPRRARILDCPEPGFFRLHLAKKGPWVPALIWLPCPMIIPDPLEDWPPPSEWCRAIEFTPRQSRRELRCRIGGSPWPLGDGRDADPMYVWERGYRIPAQEYYWRVALADWAVTQAPAQPEAHPKKAVDLAALPSLF